jgi:hypothetical protein
MGAIIVGLGGVGKVVLPPDPRLQGIHLRAEQTALLGKILAFLRQVEDPQTHDQASYLYFADPHTGVQRNEKVCPAWKDVVTTLREAQAGKEIDKQSTDTTLLEILEREILARASRKQTRAEKERLFSELSVYLQDVLATMGSDGHERRPAYQKDLRICNEFVKQYALGTLSAEQGTSV